MVVALFEWFWAIDDWNEFLNEHLVVREFDNTGL